MASSVPAVITALTDLATANLPGVAVVEGETGTFVAAEQFVIGDVTGNDTPAVLVGGAPQLFAESYDVACKLRTFAGGDDLNARRTRGLAMKASLRDAVAADMSLGISAALRCYLSSYTVRAGFDENGVACEIDLTFHVDYLEA